MIKYVVNALEGFKANRVRNLLTILGIMIGAACITLVLGLVDGFKTIIKQPKVDYQAQTLVIKSKTKTVNEAFKVGTDFWGQYNSLSFADYKEVKQMSETSIVTPITTAIADIENGKKYSNRLIIGSTTDLPQTMPIKMATGDFLNEKLIENAVIIGQDLADEMYNTDQVIGKIIKIKGNSFTILGVIKSSHNPHFNFNKAAIINLKMAQKTFTNSLNFRQINFQLKSKTDFEQFKTKLEGSLHKHHQADDFVIFDPLLETDYDLSLEHKILINLMLVMAIISLVIGGIGLMNIMLVNVAERTYEIGVRKAVGARSRQILLAFLFESLVLAVIGGLLGFILALMVKIIVSNWLFLPVAFSWKILGQVLAWTIIVGLISGILPALKAAAKDPIESLRRL